MGQSQSSVFVLQNDSNQVPVTFTKELVEKLTESERPVENVPKTAKTAQIRKLVFEQKSSKDLEAEIDGLLQREAKLPVIRENPKLKEIETKLVECYKTKKSLDCYQYVDELHEMERTILTS